MNKTIRLINGQEMGIYRVGDYICLTFKEENTEFTRWLNMEEASSLAYAIKDSLEQPTIGETKKNLMFMIGEEE